MEKKKPVTGVLKVKYCTLGNIAEKCTFGMLVDVTPRCVYNVQE